MDKVASNSADKVDPRSAAVSLQNDFAKLVLLFEQELAADKIDPATKPHIAEAKDAAQRGLELSKQLSGLVLKVD